jgi:hypothetical protein
MSKIAKSHPHKKGNHRLPLHASMITKPMDKTIKMGYTRKASSLIIPTKYRQNRDLASLRQKEYALTPTTQLFNQQIISSKHLKCRSNNLN